MFLVTFGGRSGNSFSVSGVTWIFDLGGTISNVGASVSTTVSVGLFEVGVSVSTTVSVGRFDVGGALSDIGVFRINCYGRGGDF